MRFYQYSFDLVRLVLWELMAYGLFTVPLGR